MAKTRGRNISVWGGGTEEEEEEGCDQEENYECCKVEL